MQQIQRIWAGEVWHEHGFQAGQTVVIDGGKITALETDSPTPAQLAAPGTLGARDGLLIPGLIDLQVNGALGWSFQAQHRAHFDAIVDFHRTRGTTTLLPTLVTADAPGELKDGIRRAEAASDSGAAAGKLEALVGYMRDNS